MIELYHGDCLEVMKDIADDSIDMVVTSPPYDKLRDYNGSISQWSFEKFQAIARELFRVVMDGGIVVWIVADSTVNGSETGTSFRQALYFKECGFRLHDTMIWEKPTSTATGSLSVRYASVFEYMFVLSKGRPKTFNPIKDKPNKEKGLFKKATSIRTKNGFRRMSKDIVISEYGQRHNVWHMSPCKSSKERLGHPAPFPVQLAMDHIISWSNPQDVVLDPLMGSGTTGIACLRTNRNFIGMEIDQTYFDIAKKRIDDEQRRKEAI